MTKDGVFNFLNFCRTSSAGIRHLHRTHGIHCYFELPRPPPPRLCFLNTFLLKYSLALVLNPLLRNWSSILCSGICCLALGRLRQMPHSEKVSQGRTRRETGFMLKYFGFLVPLLSRGSLPFQSVLGLGVEIAQITEDIIHSLFEFCVVSNRLFQLCSIGLDFILGVP